jgi:hypothetical protein
MRKGILKRIFCAGLAVLVVVSLFACYKHSNGGEYNATLYDDAKEFMKSDFLLDNLTYGIYYNGETLRDESKNPTYKIYIVREQSAFEQIFNGFPTEINFENEMLIIYIFTTIYSRPCSIKRISIYDKIGHFALKIEFKIESVQFGHYDSSMPYQRCFVVKMARLNIDEVIFDRNQVNR